jgi:DNA mismatch endonuclease (patch repair protein)
MIPLLTTEAAADRSDNSRASYMDRLTRAQRSKLMSAVGSRDTSPELRVRRILHRLGFRFRLHRKDLPGRPDIVLPRLNTVVFVHGCFWHGHGCIKGRVRPASNADFWDEKLASNQARDQRNLQDLAAAGWKAIVIWECETRSVERLAELLPRPLRR